MLLSGAAFNSQMPACEPDYNEDSSEPQTRGLQTAGLGQLSGWGQAALGSGRRPPKRPCGDRQQQAVGIAWGSLTEDGSQIHNDQPIAMGQYTVTENIL